MGNKAIKSDAKAASKEARQLVKNLEGYCSFKLRKIASAAPVGGSTVHDGLGAGVTEALLTWLKLIEAEASAIEKTAKTFESVDSAIMKEFLGIENDPFMKGGNYLWK
ncbi:MAG: hypothetical protein LBB42_00370 [Coriobacteriales bacterium]|jgi:hypothetical protein|nr:hypothetical protein [Coriobacteriales bacterium]